MIRAGELRQRMTFQRRTMEPDGSGGQREKWIDVAQAWVALEPVSGRHAFYGGKEGQRVTHRIKARYEDGIQTGDRGVYDERIFKIVSVLNTGERDRELVLTAEETS